MSAATVEVLNRCMTQNTWRRARGSSRHCCNHWQNPAQASLMHHQPMPHTSVSQHRPPRANAVAPSGQTWSEYAPGMSTEGHPLVAWSLAAVAVLHTGLGMVTGWDVIKAGVAEGLVGVWAAPAEHRRLAHSAQHRRSGTGETQSRSAPTSDRRSGGIDCRRGSDHARLWLLDADDTARHRRSPTAKGPAAQTVSRVTPHRRGPGDRDVVDDAPPSDQNPTAGRKVRTDLSSRRDAQPGSAPRPRAGCAPGPWCRARAL